MFSCMYTVACVDRKGRSVYSVFHSKGAECIEGGSGGACYQKMRVHCAPSAQSGYPTTNRSSNFACPLCVPAGSAEQHLCVACGAIVGVVIAAATKVAVW